MGSKHQVERSYEVFVILVNGGFQTIRAEYDAAFEVRDNFNAMFSKHGSNDVAQVVLGTISYNPGNVVSENAL